MNEVRIDAPMPERTIFTMLIEAGAPHQIREAGYELKALYPHNSTVLIRWPSLGFMIQRNETATGYLFKSPDHYTTWDSDLAWKAVERREALYGRK